MGLQSPKVGAQAFPGLPDKTPISMLALGNSQTLLEKRTTKDGQPEKRRGPKPNSKPAMTRRQELNRQAQRTHRERKEHYVKALEDEVLRLKELYRAISQEKEGLADENRHLRALLSQPDRPGSASLWSGDSTSNPYQSASSHNTSPFTPVTPKMEVLEKLHQEASTVTHASTPLYGQGRSTSSGVWAIGGDGQHRSPGFNSGLRFPHRKRLRKPRIGQSEFPTSEASVGGLGTSQNSDHVLPHATSVRSSCQGQGRSPTSEESGAMDPSPGWEAGKKLQQAVHLRRPCFSQGSSPAGKGSGAGVGFEPKSLRLDLDQTGIDFVLTLEKPCMEHLPWLLERRTESHGAEACGHVLMASCRAEPFPDNHFPLYPPQRDASQVSSSSLASKFPIAIALDTISTFEVSHTIALDDTARGMQTLGKTDLGTLLDLSKRLNLDGEITPVMAWVMVREHPRVYELEANDFQRLVDELVGKIRCYGFGAVMEEFEVRDAIENVFATKLETGMAY